MPACEFVPSAGRPALMLGGLGPQCVAFQIRTCLGKIRFAGGTTQISGPTAGKWRKSKSLPVDAIAVWQTWYYNLWTCLGGMSYHWQYAKNPYISRYFNHLDRCKRMFFFSFYFIGIRLFFSLVIIIVLVFGPVNVSGSNTQRQECVLVCGLGFLKWLTLKFFDVHKTNRRHKTVQRVLPSEKLLFRNEDLCFLIRNTVVRTGVLAKLLNWSMFQCVFQS